MRFIVVSLLFLFSAFTWSASAKQTVDDLVTQVSPLWKPMRPACLLAKDIDTQQALERFHIIARKGFVGEISNFFRDSFFTVGRRKDTADAFDDGWATVASK